MIGLNEAWYKNYPRSSFHSFNDNQQWLQMDKVGHFMTSYHLGAVGKESFEAMGMKPKNAVAWGGSVGLIFLTGIEVLDGFSKEWGFSWGDQAFNTLGAGLYIGQELAWHEQRIKLKFSYSSTDYPQYNPEILGSGGIEKALKDYNGQTYWASINMYDFLDNKQSRFPKWLNIAVGYGANGLLGGNNNSEFMQFSEQVSLQRSRQYYLSLDIDLSKIESNSKIFNVLKKSIGFIKIPAPTLEFNHDNTRFYWLYF